MRMPPPEHFPWFRVLQKRQAQENPAGVNSRKYTSIYLRPRGLGTYLNAPFLSIANIIYE